LRAGKPHFLLSTLFLGIVATSSCRLKPDQGLSSDVQFRTKTYLGVLIPRLATGKIRACVDGSLWLTRPEHEQIVRDAFSDWISTIQTIDPSRRVELAFDCATPDLKITFGWEGRAHYFPGHIWVYQYYGQLTETPYQLTNTLRHELGHAFGLWDTYVEGTQTAAHDHPDSVMTGAFAYTVPDDDRGLAILYGAHFGARVDLTGISNLSPLVRELRLSARVGGDTNKVCFYQQYLELMTALRALAPEKMERLVALGGTGSQKSLFVLSRSNYPILYTPLEARLAKDSLQITFASSILRADPEREDLDTSTATSGLFRSGSRTCTVVNAEAITRVLRQKL
jgi:hypothetical protein